jgi:group I intron endonuclease
MNAHIYLVTNTANGKQYVGQTATDANKRGHGRVMVQAYKKHGFDGFTYDRIISGINDRNTLNCIERFWIATFDSVVPNGYNLESGGSEGQIWTDERRAKHSAARIGKPLNRPLGSKSGMKGKVYPESGKLKLSLALTGRVSPNWGKLASEETKAKMSASQRQYWDSLETHPNAGKIPSLETRAKMSASKRSQVQSEETKRKRSESITAWHKQRKEQICL